MAYRRGRVTLDLLLQLITVVLLQSDGNKLVFTKEKRKAIFHR
jgi:hypothetical protein